MSLTRRGALGAMLAALMAGTLSFGAAQAQAPASASAPAASAAERVRFVTSAGNFTIEVYPDAAPKTVANFLEYVN
ncbi:peptidylprolyl isomerase, partial [Acinetobacter baumannii]|nr:peptidylprolyl isomerase [Acinetobacter baumannii]